MPESAKAVAMLKHYLLELLDPLASITPLCGLVGIAFASLYVRVNIANALLLLVALMLANMAVDTLNAYGDYQNGIDAEVVRTKFSGGTVKSTYLAEGKIRPKQTLWLALAVFALALAAGAYFFVKTPVLIPIAAFGAAVVLGYTHFLLKMPYVAEFMLVLVYTLVPLGSFIAITGATSHLLNASFVSVPVGILVSMVLLVNEIPDRDIDKKHGRKSVAVMLYDTRAISRLYFSMQLLGIIIVLAGVALRLVPPYCIDVLFATPFMLAAQRGINRYNTPKQFEKSMGFNVAYFIAFVLLLALGVFAAAI
ncbi:MAG: prenyltransferase [Candidatus Micrarchaeia archaeon]